MYAESIPALCIAAIAASEARASASSSAASRSRLSRSASAWSRVCASADGRSLAWACASSTAAVSCASLASDAAVWKHLLLCLEPFELRYGFAGKLRFKVPWATLRGGDHAVAHADDGDRRRRRPA